MLTWSVEEMATSSLKNPLPRNNPRLQTRGTRRGKNLFWYDFLKMEQGKTPIVERRRSPRYPVEGVQGTLHISTGAKILNMSLTGMAVETDTQMRVSRSYSLALRHGEEFVVRLSGTVVWCHLRTLRKTESGETKSVYHAGFRFDDTLTDRAIELTHFLEATAVIAVEQRISGRFKLKFAKPVDLDTAYRFTVKTISASGVLIETDVPAAVGTVFDMETDLHGVTLEARGRVANSREVSDAQQGRVSLLGIEFVQMQDRDRRALEEFIASHLQ